MDELNMALEESRDGTAGMYLTFAVDNEDYGVDIAYVTEIINMQAVTEVPELPPHIKGIINLRGKIIPVMDVRVRFNKTAGNYNDRTCIIVVDIGDTGIGLIVDMVRDVMHIDEGDIVPPAAGAPAAGGNRYISGIAKTGDRFKLLLDIERLVADE